MTSIAYAMGGAGGQGAPGGDMGFILMMTAIFFIFSGQVVWLAAIVLVLGLAIALNVIFW